MPNLEQMSVHFGFTTFERLRARGRRREICRRLARAWRLHFRSGMYDPNSLNGGNVGALPDVVCLSHLRWNFVFQRPQHLMVRFARNRRFYFVEEPVFDDIDAPTMSIDMHDGVSVVVPRLPRGFDAQQSIAAQRAALDDLIARQDLSRFVLWYYTPYALRFS